MGTSQFTVLWWECAQDNRSGPLHFFHRTWEFCFVLYRFAFLFYEDENHSTITPGTGLTAPPKVTSLVVTWAWNKSADQSHSLNAYSMLVIFVSAPCRHVCFGLPEQRWRRLWASGGMLGFSQKKNALLKFSQKGYWKIIRWTFFHLLHRMCVLSRALNRGQSLTAQPVVTARAIICEPL